MGIYDNMIERDGGIGSEPREIPQEVSRNVIAGAVKKSLALQLCQVRVMPSRSWRAPALALLPVGGWLTGADQKAKDKAQKPTTYVQWDNVTMTAEEFAVMVPIPDNYIADTGVDLFAEIQPLLSEEIGRALDAAVFFGYQSPWLGASDSDSLYKRAVAAGNTVTYDPNQDYALQVAALGKKLAVKGYNPTQFVVQPGFSWSLASDRTDLGVSPYAPSNGVDNIPDRLYGKPMSELDNGAWDNTRALLMAGDFSKSIVGVRQDITYKLFDQGIITDGAGNVVYNSMQQDGKVLRVVCRFAFCSVNPISRLNSDLAGYPFAVLRPSGAPAT